MKTSIDPDSWDPGKQQWAADDRASAPLAGRAPTFGDQHLVKRLTQMLVEQEIDIAGALLNGAPSSMEGYRELVGKLQGIRMAKEFLSKAQREINQGGEPAAKQEGELYGI